MTFPEARLQPLLQLTVCMCWCGFGCSAVWLQISGLPAAAALKWTEWSQSDVQRNALQVSVTALHAVRSTEVMSTLAQWATLKPAHCKQPMLTCQWRWMVRQGELSLQFLLTNDDSLNGYGWCCSFKPTQPLQWYHCSRQCAESWVSSYDQRCAPWICSPGSDDQSGLLLYSPELSFGEHSGEMWTKSGRSIEVPLKTIQKCTWRWPWVFLSR